MILSRRIKTVYYRASAFPTLLTYRCALFVLIIYKAPCRKERRMLYKRQVTFISVAKARRINWLIKLSVRRLASELGLDFFLDLFDRQALLV